MAAAPTPAAPEFEFFRPLGPLLSSHLPREKSASFPLGRGRGSIGFVRFFLFFFAGRGPFFSGNGFLSSETGGGGRDAFFLSFPFLVFGSGGGSGSGREGDSELGGEPLFSVLILGGEQFSGGGGGLELLLKGGG